MSPQKKLLLRRNALFRQQLSTKELGYQYGQRQTPLPNNTQALELHHETAGRDDSAAAYSLHMQPQAEH